MINGVSPSSVWLPAGPWTNVYDYFKTRFPTEASRPLLDNLARGEVYDAEGRAVYGHSAYLPSTRLYYYRVKTQETPIPFQATILHRDDEILVADKPHFLPVVPTGRYLQETLLVRLKRELELPELTPIHRLDMDTAGVVVLSIRKATRGAYQSLFQKRAVRKTYEAVAPRHPTATWPLAHRSRMVAMAEPFFMMQEVPGEPNSTTEIDVIQPAGDYSLYRLKPTTGRKHQLRLHMAALGMPIVNDRFYPTAQPERREDDFSEPLQLLARSISFRDPLTGKLRYFSSKRKLVLADG